MKNFIAKSLKKVSILSLLVVVALVGLAVFTTNSASAASDGAVYRFFRASTGEHFYTASVAEKDMVTSRWGSLYAYEGVAWTRTEDPVSVYRFYNSTTGDHFFTANVAERNNVIVKWPTLYQYEGVAWEDQLPGGPVIQRFLNLKTGSHFYTASETEKANVIAKWPTVYQYEGIAWGGEAVPPEIVAVLTGADVAITEGSIDFRYTFASAEGPITYGDASLAPYYLDDTLSTVTLSDGDAYTAPVSVGSLGIANDGTVEYTELADVLSYFPDLNFVPTQVIIHLEGATDVNGGADAWAVSPDVTVALDPTETALLTPAAPIYDLTLPLDNPTVSVAYGTPEVGALDELDTTVGVVGSLGEPGTADITWTIAAYDGDIAGDYTATGVLTLPLGWDGTAADVTAVVTVDAAVPTEDMAFALTTPSGGSNSLTGGGATRDVTVHTVNGTTSVVITGTKTVAQTAVVKGFAGELDGLDALNVTTTGTNTAPIYTVNTVTPGADIHTSGGTKWFTIVVSEAGKSDITYSVLVYVD